MCVCVCACVCVCLINDAMHCQLCQCFISNGLIVCLCSGGKDSCERHAQGKVLKRKQDQNGDDISEEEEVHEPVRKQPRQDNEPGFEFDSQSQSEGDFKIVQSTLLAFLNVHTLLLPSIRVPFQCLFPHVTHD